MKWYFIFNSHFLGILYLMRLGIFKVSHETFSNKKGFLIPLKGIKKPFIFHSFLLINLRLFNVTSNVAPISAKTAIHIVA